MRNGIKVNAVPNQDNQYFEVVFTDGSDKKIGTLLRNLFEATGWSVIERRSDEMTIWEVYLPYGQIVSMETRALIDRSLSNAGAPRCMIAPVY